VKSFARISLALVLAILVNGGLYLLVPYIQVLIQRKAGKPIREKVVTTEVAVAPPEEQRAQRRVIKEIKTESYRPPSMATARPSLPGGGLKIDLSPAGGAGEALVSGGDRTGGIGSGSGNGQGTGLAAMTYEPGQTDTDAKMVGPDCTLDYPARAEREGVTGYVDLTFVVTESGSVEQVTLLKEEPGGYHFGAAGIDCVKKLRFKPATLQKMSVRQRFKRRFNFDQ
jgi:periplasmic protein TonB